MKLNQPRKPDIRVAVATPLWVPEAARKIPFFQTFFEEISLISDC